MAGKGLLYVGSGVSGGEDGARYGPSLMPGGAPEAWWVGSSVSSWKVVIEYSKICHVKKTIFICNTLTRILVQKW